MFFFLFLFVVFSSLLDDPPPPFPGHFGAIGLRQRSQLSILGAESASDFVKGILEMREVENDDYLNVLTGRQIQNSQRFLGVIPHSSKTIHT
jgi:hypothetical protein